MTAKNKPARSTAPQLWRALTIAALAALAIAITRSGMVAVAEISMHGKKADVMLFGLAGELGMLLAHSTLAGLGVGLISLAAGKRRVFTALLWLAVLPLLYSALAAWPWSQDGQIPSWNSNTGRVASGGLAFIALVLVCLAAWRGRRPAGEDWLARWSVAATALSTLLIIWLAGGEVLRAATRQKPGKVLHTTRVVHEIALEPDLWDVLEHPPGGQPRALVITPSLDYRIDGGDRPTLVMPPPSLVRFTVPDDGGQVWLKGSTGVDAIDPTRIGRRFRSAVVRFAVEVDGREVWHSNHVIKVRDQDGEELAWQDLRDIPLYPGQEVQLKSDLIEFEGGQAMPMLAMGFGSLILEQRYGKQLTSATPEAPNVVLIVMDTLRQDRLSCYGYDFETTPTLDSLAQRGILYENAYSSAPWTWPATASILTGLHPETHGVLADGECYLNSEIETLPELLGKRGFLTGAFSCNPLIVPNKNFDQGFDSFQSKPAFQQSSRVIGDIRNWVRMNSRTRFFLYVQLTDTHEAYHPIPEARARAGGKFPSDPPLERLHKYQARLLRGEGHDAQGNSRLDEVMPPAHRDWIQHAYDAAVISADYYVGEILDELAGQGLMDRTIVAFTSDHGEELGDHGMLTHGHSLFPELSRVPLILAGPGLPRGLRNSTPVSNRHLAPTLAAIGNAVFEHEQEPLLLTLPDTVRAQPIYMSTQQGWWNGSSRVDIHGLREGDWEFHWAPEGAAWGAEEPPKDGDWRLYHIARDPRARRDLASEHPERARTMLATLRQHIERARGSRTAASLAAGRRTLNALGNIGYIETEELPKAEAEDSLKQRED
jgi:arylsulfatase A-like enzyme